MTDGPEEPDEGTTPATAGEEPTTAPVMRNERSATSGVGSSWSIDWKGVALVAVLGVVALVAWRWFADGSDESADADTASTAASTTSVSETTPAPTTTRATTTTTSPPTTTTTTVPAGPRVDIVGEVKPCRFGDACLVASFTISGFDGEPDRYFCIYPNSRSDFGFNDDGEDDACFSGDEGDTIAIEVDGVVSNTISADNLTGE